MSEVDLRQLAVRRDGEAPHPPARPRHLVSRYLLPAAVLVGFLGVLGWAARDSLLPSRPVTVVPVLVSRVELHQEGTPLFQAAAWVEPRPTPVLVTALSEGVVDRLLVVEGQQVKAGEPVATLIDADARLALRAAEADLRLRRADVAGARGALRAARTNAEQPAHLRAALAEAEAMLAGKETELAGLPFQLRSAEARLDLARTDLAKKQRGWEEGVIPERAYRQAGSELKAAAAAAEELKARAPRLRREVEAQRGRRDALRQRLELRTEEARALAEAQANVEAAEARLQQAEAALDAARLRLERMTVRAPAAGRVLSLVARPGTRLMGLAPGSLQESSTVVSLYDPARLQVRADVRLEDVPRVRPGQAVKIETPAAPGGPLDGEVLFATAQADIQKNTLQVKVAVRSPPPMLRPDMLAQVTFLAPAEPGKGSGPGPEPLRLLVPRDLVEAGEGGGHVWVADQAAGVARRKAVKLGAAAGPLVEVVEGLNAADRLIAAGREGLSDGERVTVTGEEAPPAAGARPSAGRTVPPSRRPAGRASDPIKH
jgi:RND family efflux transporter MFP subunit